MYVKYVYDFGDYWKHEIRVEKVENTRPGYQHPISRDRPVFINLVVSTNLYHIEL
ncbi:IS1096 element passenger TnpR family protein [Dyadobacter sp. LHD-138]|uniref:IS1096 element passenger TnpR family protein n=1 Tax=Dyadobacter sp. LHD-138 TaxID=3071413 RepID=UPI0038D3B709